MDAEPGGNSRNAIMKGCRKMTQSMFQLYMQIPVGHSNAITMDRLIWRTGMTDREIRKSIADLNNAKGEEECATVLNFQDGKGYFISHDESEIRHYLRQEWHRISTTIKKLNQIAKRVGMDENQTTLEQYMK